MSRTKLTRGICFRGISEIDRSRRGREGDMQENRRKASGGAWVFSVLFRPLSHLPSLYLLP